MFSGTVLSDQAATVAAVSISEAMAPPWTVVPMVTSDSANGSVSTATSGCISVNCMPKCPTKGEVGKNWRIKSARDGDLLSEVLIIYLLSVCIVPNTISCLKSSATSQNILGQQTRNPLLISPRPSLLHLLDQRSKDIWERAEQVQLALVRVCGDSFNL